MKPILIVLFLFVATIYIYSNDKDKPELAISEVKAVAIDTLEFIDFWDNFRSAVLNHDTITLVSMIEDEIVGDCFRQFPDLHERDDKVIVSNRKLTKSRLITLWDSLFTEAFIALMEKYNLKEDLQTGRNSFAVTMETLDPKDILYQFYSNYKIAFVRC